MFKYTFLILFLCFANISESQENILTPNEYVSTSLFNDFFDSLKLYVNQYPSVLVDSSGENEDTIKADKLEYLKARQRDSAKAKDILKKFFNLNDGSKNSVDSSMISKKLLDFYNSFDKESLTFIKIKPLRFCNDKYLYSKLTNFQKENTYVVFNSRNPEKNLFYMLILPPSSKNESTTPKILSWEIVYINGGFYFQNLCGKYGIETLLQKEE